MKRKWIVVAILIALTAASYYLYSRSQAGSNNSAVESTKTVTKGTLVTSISATGSITSGNTTNISTKASGTVTKVYVKNGDTVKKGQKILDITLDSDGIERRSAAWQTYLKAQEDVVAATKNKQDLSIQVWKDKQAILDAESAWEAYASSTTLTDAERHQKEEAVTQSKLAFDVDAAKLAHADETIAATKITQAAAYLDYQDVSGTIIAPASGIINNLTLTAGSTLVANSTQSTTSGASLASAQNIGFVRAANNQYQAKVSLTEVDAPKVLAGQKVNITMDAHSDKTFTGTVLAVDVSGTSSSGVSSYPATILMDPTELPIYPNMSVSATIITNIYPDVLLLPSTAITTSNGVSTVSIKKDNQISTVAIDVGASNDTETVVMSGLNEGDVIVVGSATSTKNNNESSIFSNTRTGAGARLMGGPGL